MTVVMETVPTCAACGTPLNSSLCPCCLLAVGLSPEPDEARTLPDAQTPLARLGDYELLEEIGRGGMGVVYRARQVSLNRLVALKLLPFGGLAGTDAALRLRAEAVAAGGLRYPHIVAIHEVGLHQGQHFLAMDYVAGPSLARLLRDGPLPSARAATLMLQVTLAVQHAHDRGIIHRDLKPSNILLGAADDEPRVTDFGLAKNLFSDTQLTLTGQTLGSPNYIPPEQIRGTSQREEPQSKADCQLDHAEQRGQSYTKSTATGGRVSFASDVYGLGAILYHTLTGRPPFQGEQISEILQQVLHEEPVPPHRLNPSVPTDLETICLKCLEKEPERRYATARQLAHDLDCFLKDEPIQARSITHVERAWRWSQRKPAMATSLFVILFLLLIVIVGSPIALYQINQGRARAEAETLKAHRFQYASDMNSARYAVQDGDLFRAVQLLERHRTSDLRGWEWRYFWKQCQGAERFILGVHTNGATSVGVLPNGKAFSAGKDKLVRVWDLKSRRQIGLLTHPERIVGAAASRDGRWLATVTENVHTNNQPVRLWDMATRQVAAILATNFWPRPTLTFSPDSKLLAWVDHGVGIHLCDVASQREITNLPAYYPLVGPMGIAFSPDSRILAYNEDGNGLIRLWDLVRGVSIGHLAGHGRYVWALAFSPDGTVLASGARDRTVRIWRHDERRELFTVTNETYTQTLAFSPDGRTLAMGGWDQKLRLIDTQTGLQTAELAGHLNAVKSLAFSPDGQMLLSASADGTVRVWNAAPHSKEPTAQFLPSDVSMAWESYGGPALCLSPDGRFLLTVHTDQTFSLWDTLKLQVGPRYRLPFANTRIAAIAAGGQQAAFASESGEVTLWDAGSRQLHFFARPETNDIHRLAFSPDGKRLVTGSFSTIRVFDVAAVKQTHALSTDGLYVMSLAISQDGKVLMAGFNQGVVKLWRLNGSASPMNFFGHEWQVRGLALSPDGLTLVSAAADMTIRIWDVRERQLKVVLTPRPALFLSCALSPDGNRLAVGDTDSLVTIWDVPSRQEVATLKGDGDSILHLAFTPDGNNLVSVSPGRLHIWHAPTFDEVNSAAQLNPSETQP